MKPIRSKLAIAFGLLLMGWLGYAYWQIRNLDPEGGCKELKYFSLCSDAWIDAWVVGLPWHFQTLPTDEEMIERFKMHRGDFEAMKNKAVSFVGGYVDRQWEKKTGVYGGESVLLYPRNPEEKVKHTAREWGYEFWVASTRYVKDSTANDMGKLLRSKGYLYFKTPPQIEDGYLLDFQHEGYPQRKWRLLPSLDGPPWPSDWETGHCWMRQIEPQWFLSLCRDQFNGVGG